MSIPEDVNGLLENTPITIWIWNGAEPTPLMVSSLGKRSKHTSAKQNAETIRILHGEIKHKRKLSCIFIINCI